MLGGFLAALDQTIVSVALPSHRRRPRVGLITSPGSSPRTCSRRRSRCRSTARSATLGPQACLPFRARDLPRPARCSRGNRRIDEGADRLAGVQGIGRGDGRRADDDRGHGPAAGARPLHGSSAPFRASRRSPARYRRLARRPPLVALGLLRERAVGIVAVGDRDHPPPPAHTAQVAPHRLPRRRAPYRRRRRAILLATWGGTQYKWGSNEIVGLGIAGASSRRLHLVGALRPGADSAVQLFRSPSSASPMRWASRSGWRCSARHLPPALPSDRLRRQPEKLRACGLIPLIAGLLVIGVLRPRDHAASAATSCSRSPAPRSSSPACSCSRCSGSTPRRWVASAYMVVVASGSVS